MSGKLSGPFVLWETVFINHTCCKKKMSMKRKRSPEGQLSGPLRLSKSDIEEMVMSKVRVALGELESTRKEQQQKIKELDSAEKNFEDKLKKLRAHIHKVKRRGDAARAYIRHLTADQRSSLQSRSTTPHAESFAPGPVISSRSSDSGDGFSDGGFSLIENNSEELGSGQPKRKAVEGFWQGRRARVEIVDLTAEDTLELNFSEGNNALPHATDDAFLKIIKVEKKDDAMFSGLPQTAPAPSSHTPPPPVKVEPESPKPVNIKTEETPYDISESAVQQEAMKTAQAPSASPSGLPTHGNTSNTFLKEASVSQAKKILVRDANGHRDDWRKKLHPLPERPFPSSLPAAAASKNLPQALSLKVWHAESAERPEGVYLRWNVVKEDPFAPPMDSYFIHVAQENPDATFSQWTQIGHVDAMALPMGCHLSCFHGYRRLCFAMVGKDKFGRYGPYSQVESICAKSAKPNKTQ